MFGNEKHFKGDGKTRYKLSSFLSKNAKEVRLTNDERRQLLTVFSPKKRVHNGGLLLGAAFFTFIIGVIFCVVMKIIESVLGTILCLLPTVILLIAGIYMIATAPKLEKSVIKAYELPVTDMMYRYVVHNKRYDGYYYETIDRVDAQDAEIYRPSNASRSFDHRDLLLKLDESWTMVMTDVGFTTIRFGVKTGDKVRCAVLECGSYCYISLY